jgi:hypothetical protein
MILPCQPSVPAGTGPGLAVNVAGAADGGSGRPISPAFSKDGNLAFDLSGQAICGALRWRSEP